MTNRAQRRAAAKMLAGSSGLFAHQSITDRAFEILKSNLTRYGSVLSDTHARALYKVLGRMTQSAAKAQGVVSSGLALALPCGAGKTQAVVAWVTACAEAGWPFSVIVSASKVEALCDLHRDLVANGVLTDSIAISHTKGFRPDLVSAARQGRVEAQDFASVAATDPTLIDARPVLLMTHSRLRTARGGDSGAIRIPITYGGKTRDLLVHDESLFVSDTRVVDVAEVSMGLAWLEEFLRLRADASSTSPLRAAVTHLLRTVALINGETERQGTNKLGPTTLKLAEVPSGSLDAWSRAIRRSRTPGAEEMQNLLNMGGLRVSVLRCKRGGGIVAYDVVFPAEFERFIVLDASAAIRLLTTKSGRVKLDELPQVKTYEDVTLNVSKGASGRGRVTEDFQGDDKEIAKWVTSIVTKIPTTEAIIIWTFKPRYGLDMAKELQKMLRKVGVDIDGSVDVGGIEKPRLVWMTWGSETSISEYQYASNVIFAGVLHRSDLDLAGHVIGERDHPTAQTESQEVADLMVSEAAHCVYQAMSRGSCRKTINGKAAPMKAWLRYPFFEKLKGFLDEVLPGVTYDRQGDAESYRLALSIKSALRHTAPEVTSISLRSLKTTVGANSIGRRTWQTARNFALQGLPGWRADDRSVIRI